jgi:5-methyltetrahydrofolate--homocysteine methyltransferase
MKSLLVAIDAAVQKGAIDEVTKLVQEALDSDLAPAEILEKGLRPAMDEVGKKFEKLEIYLPEMMLAADAMAVGVEILRPLLAAAGGVRHTGRIVLGTVQGDVHKIGKDIVRTMLEGAGFEVFDLGHDVPDNVFAEKVRELNPDILAMSALMTTTMQNIPRVMDKLQALGLREQVKVLVGGAPVLPHWAEEIGAEGYGENAAEAVKVSKRLVG